MTFQLDVQLSVGVFHTAVKGLLGKGGPLTPLQAHGNAVKRRATTERNPCMLDAILCHASPTVTCHMLITRPSALFLITCRSRCSGRSWEVRSLHNHHLASPMEETSGDIRGRYFICDLLLRMHRDRKSRPEIK